MIKCHYPNVRSHNRLCAWGWMLLIFSDRLRTRQEGAAVLGSSILHSPDGNAGVI